MSKSLSKPFAIKSWRALSSDAAGETRADRSSTTAFHRPRSNHKYDQRNKQIVNVKLSDSSARFTTTNGSTKRPSHFCKTRIKWQRLCATRTTIGTNARESNTASPSLIVCGTTSAKPSNTTTATRRRNWPTPSS